MPLTETERIVLAGVHVLLQVITEVQFRTDLIAIHRRRHVLILIEEIPVMRCVHLPRAEVIDPVPLDHQDIPDPHRQQEVPEAQVTCGVPEARVTYGVLEAQEVPEAQVV